MTDEIKKHDTCENDNCECEEAEIVEFSDENGKVMKFYHLDTIKYEDRFFAFFIPAEELEGIDPEELIIYEVTGNPGEEELLPVLDDDLLDAVYQEFCDIMDEEECTDDDCACCHHHDHCHE